VLNFQNGIFSTDDSRNSGRKVNATIIPGKDSEISAYLAGCPLFRYFWKMLNINFSLKIPGYICEAVFFINYGKHPLLKETGQTFKTYCSINPSLTAWIF